MPISREKECTSEPRRFAVCTAVEISNDWRSRVARSYKQILASVQRRGNTHQCSSFHLNPNLNGIRDFDESDDGPWRGWRMEKRMSLGIPPFFHPSTIVHYHHHNQPTLEHPPHRQISENSSIFQKHDSTCQFDCIPNATQMINDWRRTKVLTTVTL